MSALADSLSPRQIRMLRYVARYGSFDFLDPAEYWSSGSLGVYNVERTIASLRRRGLIDGDKITDAGRDALARCGGAVAGEVVRQNIAEVSPMVESALTHEEMKP